MSSVMIGGVMEMVKSVLQQVLQQGSLKVLDFKDKKIVVEQGQNVAVVIIVDAVSDSLNVLLHDFTAKFERFFSAMLKDWAGDSSVFEPARVLIKEVFG